MTNAELKYLITQGTFAVERGNFLLGLVHFEAASEIEKTPTVDSYLGLCLAGERRQFQRALALCGVACQRDPTNSLHYLNLGRVYLIAGQKSNAIRIFRRGLKIGRNPRIVTELKNLGVRKPPVMAVLPRENPLNKYLGLLSAKLGFR
jgi:tetratricopeptide (TPR) repeat protein